MCEMRRKANGVTFTSTAYPIFGLLASNTSVTSSQFGDL